MKRALAVLTVMLTLTAALSACNGPSGTAQNPAQVADVAINDVALIAQGLANALPGLEASGLDPADLAKVRDITANIQAIAAAVKPGIDLAKGQESIRQLETLLNTLVATAATLPLPPQYKLALSAASVLLPVVEASAHMLAAQVGTPAPMAGPMSPDQARSVLRR